MKKVRDTPKVYKGGVSTSSKSKPSKVLLISPSYQPHWSRCEPTGLLYIASFLELNGITTKILDLNVEKKSIVFIIDLIKKESILFVGITAITRQALSAYEIGTKIKEVFGDNIYLIYGGVHPTILPEECFVKGSADFVVIGEGELIFYDLIRCILNNRNLADIEGIHYMHNKEIIENKRRAYLENLDILPFPDYSKVPLEKYNSDIHLKAHPAQAIHLMTSRGCIGSCYYCSSPFLYKRKVRFRSTTNVLEEVEQILGKYNIKNIHFHDDNFLLDPKRIKEFCQLIFKKKITFYWICLVTVKVIVENPNILPIMKKAGCVGMEVGVESGDMNVLKTLNKSMKHEDIKKAAKLLRENGIHPMFLFMSYSLMENIETSYKTIMLFYELKYGRLFKQVPVSKEIQDSDLAGHLARPSPGSVFYGIAKDRGVILSENWNDHIEEKLNFIPNEFLNDIPIKNKTFLNYNDFFTFLNKYKNNLKLYTTQNFYISFPILNEYFSNNIDELITFMYDIYKSVDGTKSVLDIVDEVEGFYKKRLTKSAVSISMMSIFRIIKSRINL